jgi:hypothetical protein
VDVISAAVDDAGAMVDKTDDSSSWGRMEFTVSCTMSTLVLHYYCSTSWLRDDDGLVLNIDVAMVAAGAVLCRDPNAVFEMIQAAVVYCS